jgi:hypothetical protein
MDISGNSKISQVLQNNLADKSYETLATLINGSFEDDPDYNNLSDKTGLREKLVQTWNWLFNPLAYSADKSAKTARINTERTLEYNVQRDTKQFKLQAIGQILQYVQHRSSLDFQEKQGNLNRNLQEDLAELQRELQEEEGRLNRESQEVISNLQRELQREEGRLNRETQAIESERNRALQAYLAQLQQDLQRGEGLLNRELQTELATLQRDFQTQEGHLNREHAIKLELFREKLHIHLFENQKQLQLEVQELNASLMRELKGLDLFNSKELVREQRRLNNFPLNMDEHQLFKDYLDGTIPLNLFLIPPVIKYDPMGTPEDAKDFPLIEMFLNTFLKRIVSKYNSQGRIVDYYDSAWRSKSFRGGAAYNNLFQGLNSNPTGIIDCLIEGDKLTLECAHWSEQFRLPTCQTTSTLIWRELLYVFTKERLLKWYIERENARKETNDVNEFDSNYNEKTIAVFLGDLQILDKDLKQIAEGNDPRETLVAESREYHIMSSDIEKFQEILAQEICLAAGLIIDEYYLLGVSPQYRKRPLLPELFTSLSSGCPKDLMESRIQRMIMAYKQMYQILEQDESAWMPEFRLGLVQSLISIPDAQWAKEWAKEELSNSLRAWLKLRGRSQPEDLEGLISAISMELVVNDIPYVDLLNQCLLTLGETYHLSVANSCYQRGVHYYQHQQYQTAISDFNQALMLNPNLEICYAYRGSTFTHLGDHERAILDYDLALNLTLRMEQENKQEFDETISKIVSGYKDLFKVMQPEKSYYISELALKLSKCLANLPDKSFASEMLNHSLMSRLNKTPTDNHAK